ncbi:MAG: MCE family protein [Actinomycetota bacterium]|nr:MCE family protein [Actinomycetota bacterium]
MRTSRLVLPVVAALLAAGCQFKGAASLPLPGGVGTGKDAYKVKVQFSDVLDLVPQSAVKVDDVTVGTVLSIELKGYTALVTVAVRKDVQLPANAHASLRQTSLLGEKFVSLDRPTGEPAVGTLSDGAFIGLDRTTRNAEVEEVLSALSLVLNGGSLEQLQTINRELVLALKGREDKVRDVLNQLNVFVTGLDKQRGDIVRALQGIDRLSTTLVAQRQVLSNALRDLPPGAKVLTDQRSQLTTLLTGLDRLGQVAVKVITASQQNTVADLRSLQPILTQLNAAGANLPNALELLTTYPFPKTVRDGIRGDYANLFATVDLDLRGIAHNVGLPPLPGGAAGQSKARPSLPPLAPVRPSGLPANLAGLLLGGLS